MNRPTNKNQGRKKVINAFKGFIKTYRLEQLSIKFDSLEPEYVYSWKSFNDEEGKDLGLYYRNKSLNQVLDLFDRLFPEQIDRKLALHLLIDATCNWITEGKDRKNQTQLEQAGSQFVSEIEAEIKPHKLYVPIGGLDITNLKSIKVANCELFGNTKDSEWKQLIAQHSKRFSEKVQSSTEWYDKVKAYSCVEIIGHPQRAVQRAIEETNLALSILRLFLSSYYFHEHERSLARRLDLFGSLNPIQTSYAWYINPNLPLDEQFPGFLESYKTYDDIEINSELFAYMKRNGLERINDLIQSIDQSKKHEIARRILRSISWYSKATSARNICDSYLMYAIAIEALLSEDRTPQETYSIQIAALVTCGKDDCSIYPIDGYISSNFSKQLKKTSNINDRFNLIYKRTLELFAYRNHIAHGAVMDDAIEPTNLLDFETIVKNAILAFILKDWQSFGDFKNWIRDKVSYDFKIS